MLELISETNYRETMENTVEPKLASIREELSLPLEDGGALHAELYEQPTATRAVVVLHGYTESGEKFREMTWYFLQSGFNVYAIDHRGHGRSARAVDETWLTHVDHFSDYVRDLEAFMDRVVLPRAQNLPLCLYAHSMGGAVGSMMLQRHPKMFARAVLTAPMIAPSSAPFPSWAGAAIAKFMCAIGKTREMAFIGKPFDPQSETFEASFGTGRARFDYYERKRLENRHLQNCAPTYGWVREAIGVTKVLLNRALDRQIETPLLLCQAARDTVVRLPEQNKFVSLLPHAQLRAFDAKHEIYMSDDTVMREYVPAVIAFLRG